jgi:hypothetical protein
VDQVAADAFGCTLIGQRPENLPYLRMARERGIGTTDWRTLRPREHAFYTDGREENHALSVPMHVDPTDAAFSIAHALLAPPRVVLA